MGNCFRVQHGFLGGSIILMITLCPKCQRRYDDEQHWTICPHGPLEFALDDYCCKCDTLKSVFGPCIHQQKEQTMTPNEYQELAARTDVDRTLKLINRMQESNPNGSLLIHACLGLPGEVGELGAAAERWIYYSQELDKANVKEEIGDCLWYLAQACRAIGVTLEEVMTANIAKLRKRFPVCYSDDLALEANRNRKVEMEVVTGVQERERVDLLPSQDQLHALVSVATKRGWIVVPSRAEEPVGRWYLKLPGDASNGWAAKYHLVMWEGRTVNVPHWLDRRMQEIKEENECRSRSGDLSQKQKESDDGTIRVAKERLGALAESTTKKVGIDISQREQTGQGWAEPSQEDESEEASEPQEPINSARDTSRNVVGNSYRICTQCKRMRVHKSNPIDVCAACYGSWAARQKATGGH